MSLHAKLEQRLLRTDWLRELHGLLVVGLALSGAGLLAVIATTVHGPLSVTVPADHVITADAPHGLTGGAALDRHGELGLVIADPTPYQIVLGVSAVLPTGLVVLTMLAVLYQVVRDGRRADPFTETTVRRLRHVSAVVIIGGLLAWTTEFCARLALTGTVTRAGTGATLTLAEPSIWLLVGFGYLAVAEIINRGRVMRAELDQVI